MNQLHARVIKKGSRFTFVCDLCRVTLPAADKAAATEQKKQHVASASHRSTLRAARRE